MTVPETGKWTCDVPFLGELMRCLLCGLLPDAAVTGHCQLKYKVEASPGEDAAMDFGIDQIIL